jgi:bacterioferritin
MSAVAQYINHSQTISNKAVSNLLLYVSLVEMYHLQLIAKMITDLGGNLRYWNSNNSYWSGGNIDYGDTIINKLSLDIYSEEEAISGYQSILREINNLNVPELSQVSAMVNRIIEDEYLHISLFKQAYQENGGK